MNSSMQLDSLTLDKPFILAPLAGYTDLAFRLLCREYGAALCYSEMISSHGLVYRQQNTFDLLQTVAEERPVNMQLFGAEPEIMGEAAKILCETVAVDCIDINMGCPVKKVIKRGAGCALMRDPKLAEQIIRKVVANATVPVTVKFRSGWNHHTITAVAFA
ncbi:MAG: tRNA-dihydrouridine synthase family protein, partial [Desulfobulbaceae bacterium]|nr:tRNA-dihydrouridine synthase family protein [Desulfobulbaceae bacterium]